MGLLKPGPWWAGLGQQQEQGCATPSPAAPNQVWEQCKAAGVPLQGAPLTPSSTLAGGHLQVCHPGDEPQESPAAAEGDGE